MSKLERLKQETVLQFQERKVWDKELRGQGYIRNRLQYDRGVRWYRYNKIGGSVMFIESYLLVTGEFSSWMLMDSDGREENNTTKKKLQHYEEAIWFFADLYAQNNDEETYGMGTHPNTEAMLEKTLDALDTIRELLPEQELLDDAIRNVIAKRKKDPFTIR